MYHNTESTTQALYCHNNHNVLPEGDCCCLQTCNFVVMLMNNVYGQSFNFNKASMCKL